MICQRAPDRRQRRAPDQVAHLVDADARASRCGPASTSAWEPASTVWHCVALAAAGSPGRCSHCSAAANAIAALDRPDPGGPVNSQAWLIPCPPAAARSASTTRCWPTRSSQTVTRRPGGVGLRRAAARPARGPAAAISSTVGAGVEHEVVVGVGGGQVEERLPHPLVELQRLAPRSGRGPRTGPARARGSRSSTTVRCGRRSRVAQRATCLDLARRRGRGRRPGRPASSRRSGR